MSNRTSNSLKNSQVAMIFYLAILGVNFISRKVFISYLGAELLGLNTTAMNLLSFLNLAELGIGTAIAYSLYEPLYNNDQKTINEIISLQGYLYKKIALIILASSITLMCFFPLIFSKLNLPFWYAYVTFSVFLIDSLSSYFLNYKQIILNASQQTYKIILITQTSKLMVIILQIIAILYLENKYINWLVIELIGTLVRTYFLNYTIKRSVPYLKTNTRNGKQLKSKYSDIIQKTKQLFIHKLAGFVLLQTTPLIIFIYVSLTVVTIYSNYMLLINGSRQLVLSIFNGITASTGHLIKEGDNNKIYSFFNELFAGIFILASVICFGILRYSNPFISLWVGDAYLIDDTSRYIIVSILFINIIRLPYDIFCDAAGMTSDVLATIAETVLNLGVSLILGYYYGLSGILSGTLISLTFKYILWKPYYLFNNLFKINCLLHHKICLFFMFSLFIAFKTTTILSVDDLFTPGSSFLNLIFSSILVTSCFVVILTTEMYLYNKYTRLLLYRISKILFKKNIFVFSINE